MVVFVLCRVRLFTFDQLLGGRHKSGPIDRVHSESASGRAQQNASTVSCTSLYASLDALPFLDGLTVRLGS